MTPKLAQELGVAIIHQELNMCAHLSVAENIFLGREEIHTGVLANRQMCKKAREVLERLNIDIDPNTIVGDLQVSKQQMVEIAKVMNVTKQSGSEHCLILLDEPTSVLNEAEVENLYKQMRKIAAQGLSLIHI